MLDVFIHTKIIVHFYIFFYLLSHFSLQFLKYAPYIDLNILIGRTDAMSLLLNIEVISRLKEFNSIIKAGLCYQTLATLCSRAESVLVYFSRLIKGSVMKI